jgi:hypothetical protein
MILLGISPEEAEEMTLEELENLYSKKISNQKRDMIDMEHELKVRKDIKRQQFNMYGMTPNNLM